MRKHLIHQLICLLRRNIIINKIKRFFHRINNTYFYGKYKTEIEYFENKNIRFVDYIFKVILIYVSTTVFLSFIYPNLFHCFLIAFIITVFLINKIFLNAKKIEYQYFVLSQLTIYASQVSMFVTYNNVYSSLKETLRFLSYPLKGDLEKVIDKIKSGKSINDSFVEFNKKYNNKTITLFNQSLELFDKYGSSDAGNVLYLISEELNNLKIKKDRFYHFKKEWRLNFYVVVFMCLSMPILLKLTMSTIYIAFMNSFGFPVMLGIFIVNLFIINKIEKMYSDLSIGEEGYR